MIDNGKGGYINIDKISAIDTFNAESLNTTNGVSTKYFLSWFTSIETKNSDIIYINFPPEMTMMPTSGDYLTCNGINGIGSATCQVTGNQLKITLNSVSQPSGLFKLSAENIKNAASLRISSKFGEVYHTTSAGAKVSEFLG